MFIHITVCIVVQFVSVDQPQRKLRANRDKSLSRCLSSSSVVACWLEFPLVYRLQLCKSTHFLPVGYPLQILIIRKEWGNTRWIRPNLGNTTGYSPHSKTTWQKGIYSLDTQTGPLAIGALYGTIHFNISLHCKESTANTTPTYALHITQTYRTTTAAEDYNTVNLKRK